MKKIIITDPNAEKTYLDYLRKLQRIEQITKLSENIQILLSNIALLNQIPLAAYFDLKHGGFGIMTKDSDENIPYNVVTAETQFQYYPYWQTNELGVYPMNAKILNSYPLKYKHYYLRQYYTEGIGSYWKNHNAPHVLQLQNTNQIFVTAAEYKKIDEFSYCTDPEIMREDIFFTRWQGHITIMNQNLCGFWTRVDTENPNLLEIGLNNLSENLVDRTMENVFPRITLLQNLVTEQITKQNTQP